MISARLKYVQGPSLFSPPPVNAGTGRGQGAPRGRPADPRWCDHDPTRTRIQVLTLGAMRPPPQMSTEALGRRQAMPQENGFFLSA